MRARSAAVRKYPMRDNHLVPTSATLLMAMEAAHRQIESSIVELDSITIGALPDVAQFSAIRLRVGQANLARTHIMREICTHLVLKMSADDGKAVHELQRRCHEQNQFISEQVRRWTPQAVQEDWQGYCGTSHKVRDQMRAIVAAEKKLLYPILARQR